MTNRKQQAKSNSVKKFDQARFNDSIRPVRKILLLIFVLTSLIIVMTGFKRFDRPLTDIVIEGDFKYVEEQEVMSLMAGELKKGFLSTDLKDVKQKMEKHPWISQVTLVRSWPSSIRADVAEEVPIARWGNAAFLNYRGKELATKSTDLLKDLPELESSSVSSEEMMSRYQILARQISETGLKITRLVCSAGGIWTITTSGGFELMLGRYQLLQKLRRFVLAWEAGLRVRYDAIKYIDLRYPNGLAVSWKNESNISRAKILNKPVIGGLLG